MPPPGSRGAAQGLGHPSQTPGPQRGAPTGDLRRAKGLAEHRGLLCQTQEGEWGLLQEVGGCGAPSGIYPPTSLPSACTAPAHAQCALALGWLGEGTDGHPHLKGQCHPCLHPPRPWDLATLFAHTEPRHLRLPSHLLAGPFCPLSGSVHPTTSNTLTSLQAGEVCGTHGVHPG